MVLEEHRNARSLSRVEVSFERHGLSKEFHLSALGYVRDVGRNTADGIRGGIGGKVLIERRATGSPEGRV